MKTLLLIIMITRYGVSAQTVEYKTVEDCQLAIQDLQTYNTYPEIKTFCIQGTGK